MVNWAPGHSLEADRHYGETGEAWCMSVDPEGIAQYLSGKRNTSASTDLAWRPDPYWQQTVRRRQLARVFQMVDADKNGCLTRCGLCTAFDVSVKCLLAAKSFAELFLHTTAP